MSNFVKTMNNNVSLGGYSDVTISGSLAVYGSLTQSGITVPNNTTMSTAITAVTSPIIASIASIQSLTSVVYANVT